MLPMLRLYEDVFSNAAPEIGLPASPRMIFVVHGAMTIDGRNFRDGEAWHGEGETWLEPGAQGVTAWRFELVPGNAADGVITGTCVRSHLKLAASLATLPAGELLLRCDSVAFPSGGCAYLHQHQGPGIRCLIEGGIRIDTDGGSTAYGPGCAWFESGPEPVFAQAAADRPTRFIRVMILPRARIGKSSIAYLNEADEAKPKSQTYKLFADAPIARPAENL